MPLVALTTLGAAALQSATGFGFALLLSPVLFAIYEPAHALGTVLLLGAGLNLLMLYGERRPREMFEAVCANCGKTASVPFRPSGAKPVYCSDCFESRR